MKFVYKVSFITVLSLFFLAHSYALNVEVHPEEVTPGDVFILEVINSGPFVSGMLPKAEFLDKNIDFFQDAHNNFKALVAVDIEISPDAYLIKIVFEGKEKTASIRVKKHDFPTQHLSLPEEKVTLSPVDLERAGKEAEQLKNILSQNTARKWEGQFIKPTDTDVSEVFGVKRIMNRKKTSIHGGMDYKGQTGTPVRSLNSGTVVLREDYFFGGNTVVVDHGMGLYSIYMHLSEFNITKDEKVSKGQVLGLIGMSGRATGPHLHLGVKLKGVNVNPEALFRLAL